MRITIGSDHGGYELKEKLSTFLRRLKHKIADAGTYNQDSCDYPDFGYKVAKSVAGKKADRGILICKSGIGMCIVANKVPGVRAAVLYDNKQTEFSRLHSDTNVAVFAASFIKPHKAKELLKIWLKTDFEGGRHNRRLTKIKKIENDFRRKTK